MAQVICPFCLKPHDFALARTCEICADNPVPDEYIAEYDRVPPLWLLTIGFSRHGKTTYLAALTLVLENMSNVWEGMYDNAYDQATMTAIRQMWREAMQGEIVQKTDVTTPRPLLIGLYGLPEVGSRSLVMYDVAGEIFDSINEVQAYLPALKFVGTTWFLVSLQDLENDQEGRSLTDLFSVYRKGMRSLQADLQGRNLIVVYTKADQVAFTPEIEEYLMLDPYQALTLPDATLPPSEDFSLQEYRQGMEQVSNLLEEYTRQRVKKGRAFINMVKAEGMNLYFSVVSALGQSPDVSSSRLRERARRYRVLDPFLWALTLQATETTRTLRIIVDGSSTSGSAYQALPAVWERLADYGEVTTYQLGDSQAKSQPGQKPPTTPPDPPRKRLIGPILEHTPPDARVLVFATGPIADLADFASTSWRDRLVLVQTEPGQPDTWPHTVTYRAGDDPTPLVNTLLRL